MTKFKTVAKYKQDSDGMRPHSAFAFTPGARKYHKRLGSKYLRKVDREIIHETREQENEDADLDRFDAWVSFAFTSDDLDNFIDLEVIRPCPTY